MTDNKNGFDEWWVANPSPEYDKALEALTENMNHGLPTELARDLFRVIWDEALASRAKSKKKANAA